MISGARGVEPSGGLANISGVNTVQEIEAAIDRLPREELRQLAEWFDRRRSEDWDQQMKEDAKSGGPLDQLAQQALAEFRQGRVTKLP